MAPATRPKKNAAKAPTPKTKAAKGAKVVKSKAPKAEKAPKKAAAKAKGASEPGSLLTSGLIIEASAFKLQTLLAQSNPSLEVAINPEKPRKGAFEIRWAETGDTIISLLNMPRPFPPLKALDIEKLAADIGNTVDSN